MTWENHLKPSEPRSGMQKWANFRSGEETSTYQVKINDEDFEMECLPVGLIEEPEEDHDDENETEGYMF
jgi:hypothetical protein